MRESGFPRGEAGLWPRGPPFLPPRAGRRGVASGGGGAVTALNLPGRAEPPRPGQRGLLSARRGRAFSGSPQLRGSSAPAAPWRRAPAVGTLPPRRSAASCEGIPPSHTHPSPPRWGCRGRPARQRRRPSRLLLLPASRLSHGRPRSAAARQCRRGLSAACQRPVRGGTGGRDGDTSGAVCP